MLLTLPTMEALPHDSMMTNYNNNIPDGEIITSPLGYINKIHLEYPLKLQYFNKMSLFSCVHIYVQGNVLCMIAFLH